MQVNHNYDFNLTTIQETNFKWLLLLTGRRLLATKILMKIFPVTGTVQCIFFKEKNISFQVTSQSLGKETKEFIEVIKQLTE